MALEPHELRLRQQEIKMLMAKEVAMDKLIDFIGGTDIFRDIKQLMEWETWLAVLKILQEQGFKNIGEIPSSFQSPLREELGIDTFDHIGDWLQRRYVSVHMPGTIAQFMADATDVIAQRKRALNKSKSRYSFDDLTEIRETFLSVMG